MNSAECPYCGEMIDINHDDGYGYDESETHKQECYMCGKTFVYTTFISYSYSTHKADCLNGAEHNWEPTKSTPKRYTKMKCSECDESRMPTAEERALYGIPE